METPTTWNEWTKLAETYGHELLHKWDTNPANKPGNPYQRYPERCSWTVGAKYRRPDGSEYTLEQECSRWSTETNIGPVSRSTAREDSLKLKAQKLAAIRQQIGLVLRDDILRKKEPGDYVSDYVVQLWRELDDNSRKQYTTQTGKKLVRNRVRAADWTPTPPKGGRIVRRSR